MGSAASTTTNNINKNNYNRKKYRDISLNSSCENCPNLSFDELHHIQCSPIDSIHKPDKFEMKLDLIQEKSMKTVDNNFDSTKTLSNTNMKQQSYTNNDAEDISAKLMKSFSQVLLVNHSHVNTKSSHTNDSDDTHTSIITFMDDDGNQSIRTIQVGCFDYLNCNVDSVRRFHSLSSSTHNSTTKLDHSNSNSNANDYFLDNGDYVNINTYVHTCNLCKMTFESENKFVEHTKFSKIHHIALLQYNSSSNNRTVV